MDYFSLDEITQITINAGEKKNIKNGENNKDINLGNNNSINNNSKIPSKIMIIN